MGGGSHNREENVLLATKLRAPTPCPGRPLHPATLCMLKTLSNAKLFLVGDTFDGQVFFFKWQKKPLYWLLLSNLNARL